MFKNAEQFLSSLLNNYQFILLLTDAFYLGEDFIKLPGGMIWLIFRLNLREKSFRNA